MHSFDDIDSGDVAAILGYLELAARQPDVERIKARSLELLGLQPSERVVEVGCGVGHEVRRMGEQVGPAGVALGVDRSHAMIQEARRRHGAVPACRFLQGSAPELELPAGGFDAARIERVLHFLPRPRELLAWTAKALRPGGRLVVVEPDWQSLILGGLEPSLTAALLASIKARLSFECQGSHVPSLLREVGFVEVQVEVVAGCMRGAGLVRGLIGLDTALERALQEGFFDREMAARFGGELEHAGDSVFAGLTAVLVRARMPGPERL